MYVLAQTLGGNSACPVIKWVNEAFVSLSGYTAVRPRRSLEHLVALITYHFFFDLI